MRCMHNTPNAVQGHRTEPTGPGAWEAAHVAKEMATVSGAPMRAVALVVNRPVELTVA